MKVVGLSGSLRQDSYNSMALRAAQRIAPAGMTIDIVDIRAIPLYDEDVRSKGEPAAVVELKERIRDANAILIATPEYNFSIPGVLKNTLDWLSRPPLAPFEEKLVAIMGASAGATGTARAQLDLRKVLVFLNALTVNKPEVLIRDAAGKFDAQGELTDETTRRFIGDLLNSLQRMEGRLRG